MKAPKKVQASAQERALADMVASQWTDYVERFRPAEVALIKQAQLTKGERAQVKGEVAGDTAAAFKGLTRNTLSSGEQTGADVNSGKTKLSLAGDADAAGQATGLGQALAITGAEIDAEQQKVRITGFGRNLATDATANLSRGAQRATRTALAASESRFQLNQARIDAVSAVAGAGVAKYKSLKAKRIADAPLDEIKVTSQRKTSSFVDDYFYEDSKG